MNSDAVKINQRIRVGRMSLKCYTQELYNRPKASFLPLKPRMVRSEVGEALLYGCMTLTPLKGHYNKLRTKHHRMLLRILGAWCKSPNERIISYKDTIRVYRLNYARGRVITIVLHGLIRVILFCRVILYCRM